ncbi:hypothetical protein Tsp_10820 [Trichinella spiralis]|uniref:hypothetical protein n=1 Tax=Trichinella spiralis TaxID=6334 RepID=UPI0001EFE3CD|nr:hypothetical protein Tsp_10820 [Trichinella spiralis]
MKTERCANKEICVRTQREKFAYGFAQTSQITTVIVRERFLVIEEKLLSVVALHLSEKDLMNDKSMRTEPCSRAYNSCKDCKVLLSNSVKLIVTVFHHGMKFLFCQLTNAQIFYQHKTFTQSLSEL